MNRKLLMLILISLALCLVTPRVSAKADVFWHDVGKDVGSDIQTTISSLPPEAYPLTQRKWTSTFTWDDRWAYNEVFDARWKMHVNVKFVNKGAVQNEIWLWNDVLEEWIFVSSWSQSLKTISGNNDLFTMSGTQTSKQLSVSRETFEMKYVDPMTGEETTYEYMVIRYTIVRWVNGELLFETSWEIMKD